MAIYETTKVKFVELEKALNRVFKKLDAIGAEYKFYKIRDFVNEVPVMAKDHVNHVTYQVGGNETIKVECVEFELDFEPFIVGDYQVGAIIEYVDHENNMVYPAVEDIDFMQYAHAELRCDHCNRKHKRSKAVVLIDKNTGEHKMVGRGCLKDFIGISVESFAKYIQDANCILDSDPNVYDYELGSYKRVIDPDIYIERCIAIIKEKGYYKMLKCDALDKDTVKKLNITDDIKEEAKAVIEFFENFEPTDTFELDTKMFVTGKKVITGTNGFVAYAYVLYRKLIGKELARQEREAQKAKSDYVGTVGERITLTAVPSVLTSWQTEFGWTTIYKFVDENSNTYIWKTSGDLIAQDEKGYDVYVPDMEEVTLKATIKEHSEFRGEKQTVLTRCKLIGYKPVEKKVEEKKDVPHADQENDFDAALSEFLTACGM